MEIEKFNQEALLSELKSCFDLKELNRIALESGFVKRSTSRVTGLSFLMMNVLDTSDGKERSLEDSGDWLEDNFNVSMTKQSLDERYNTYSVKFLNTCFSRILEIVNKGAVERKMDLPFSQKKITDATSFRIPDCLSTFYKGWKGQGGKAILKMHLNYDFLNGAVEDIFLTGGSSHDNQYKLVESAAVTPNALYMRDLGYCNSRQLKKIDNNGAYFLSRTTSNCSYYTKDEKGKYQKVDIALHLPQAGQTKEIEDIYIGAAKHRTKVRLILQAVPKEVVQQRLKKLNRYASRHPKRKISENRKSMCSFNVFVSNAPAEKLPYESARLMYTIRWQIELIFKIWKSIFKIDRIKKMSIFRFECYIYSKLIAILLTLHIHNKLGQFLWDEHELELSPMKTAKLIKKNLTA